MNRLIAFLLSVLYGWMLVGCGGATSERPDAGTETGCYEAFGCEVLSTCMPGKPGCTTPQGTTMACWPSDGSGGCWTQSSAGQTVALWSCPSQYAGQCE